MDTSIRIKIGPFFHELGINAYNQLSKKCTAYLPICLSYDYNGITLNILLRVC